MSQGARRVDARYSNLEARRNQNHGDPPSCQVLAQRLRMLAICQARCLCDDGRYREAIDLLMDLATFGRDLADRSSGTDFEEGLGAISGSLAEIRRMLPTRRLEEEDFLRLDRCLQALDDAWPDHDTALKGDLLYLGLILVEEDVRNEPMIEVSGQPRIRRNWRSFYSTRLRSLQIYSQAEAYADRVREASKRPFDEAYEVIDAIDRETRNSPHADGIYHAFCNISSSHNARRARSQVRLIRMLARYLASAETLVLEDPLGGALRLTSNNGSIRVWREDAGMSRPMPDLEILCTERR